MAKLSSLLLCFVFLAAVVVSAVKGGEDGKGNLKPGQCPGECDPRCSQTNEGKACLLFCNKCCAKCLCVPPGYYYGNKETCPCYNNWKNNRGGSKCP